MKKINKISQWIAVAAITATAACVAGGAWNSVSAAGLNEEPTMNQAPSPKGNRANGARGMRGGAWQRDPAAEAQKIADDMARDFDKTLSAAQITQLKTAIEAREAAIRAARDTFDTKMSQISGVSQEALRAKRQEMRRQGFRPGGPDGPNGKGRPQNPDNNGAPNGDMPNSDMPDGDNTAPR